MGEVIMTVLGNGVGLIVLAFGAGCVIVALVLVYFFGYAGLVTGLAKLAESEGDDPDQSRRSEELIRRNREHPIVQKIIRELVDAVLESGYTITVYDGEETVIIRSDNARNILESMGHTEADWLYWNGEDDTGSVMFVYSNEPEYVVADYSSDEFTTRIVETVIEKYGP